MPASSYSAAAFSWRHDPRKVRENQRTGTTSVTRVELSFVIEGRKGEAGRADLERLLSEGMFEVVSVTPKQAQTAIDAFRRFGKGRHRAGLNIGDCFSYALAAETGDKLLFKGNDFVHTDINMVTLPGGRAVT